MLDALVQGTTDPAVLADRARGKLRAKLPALRAALVGRFRPHHAFLVSQLLAQLDFLEETMEQVSAQIAEVVAPFTADLDRLDAIPGVNRRTAEVVIAEIGVDMGSSPPPSISRAGRVSARANTRARVNGRRAPPARATGGSAPRSSKRPCPPPAPPRALAARCRRVMRHRGHTKAVIAVAHAMLVSAYHVLAHQVPYHDRGPDYYDRRHADRVPRRAIDTLQRQGYRVHLEPAA